MICNSENEIPESITALEHVVKGGNGHLSSRESERNITDNIVTLIGGLEFKDTRNKVGTYSMSSYSGKGLRITTDGFILTAYHNIKEYADYWNKRELPTEDNLSSWMERMRDTCYVTDQAGGVYTIDNAFLMISTPLDLALIKAITLERPEPIEFRTSTSELHRGDPIKVLGLTDQMRVSRFGRIVNASVNTMMKDTNTRGESFSEVRDTFLTNALVNPGFSGGPFTTFNGEFAGVVLYAEVPEVYAGIGYAGGAKARNASILVERSVKALSDASRSLGS